MGLNDLISNYNKRISSNGLSIKDEYVNSLLDNINDSFYTSPSYYQITKNEDYITKFDAWITDEKSYDADISKKQINMKPGQLLSQGEIINWENKKWLCTKIDQQDTYWNNGLIEFCNYELKWVNQDGLVVSAWGVLEDRKSFTEGIQENKYIIVGDSNYIITLPRNDNTLEIRRDDKFLISNNSNNPIGYKVIKVNDSYKYGLIILNLQELGAEISPNDNAELMIANYYNRIASYSLQILNTPNLQQDISTELQIQVQITRTINNISTVLSPNPSLLYESSNTSICTINSTGLCTFLSEGNVDITVKLADDEEISDLISIDVISGVVDNYSYSLVGNDSIKLNQTAIYVAKRYNNSVEIVSEEFDFEVVGDVPINKYLLTIINGSVNSVNLKCLGYPHTITLRAYLRSNHGIFVEKNVDLKGII